MDKKYDGFQNYETWCVSIWVNNDRQVYECCREDARRAVHDAAQLPHANAEEGSLRLAAITLLASKLSEKMHSTHVDQAPNRFGDLLRAALGRVEWTQIAESFLDEWLPENGSGVRQEIVATAAKRDEPAVTRDDLQTAPANAAQTLPSDEAAAYWKSADYIYVYSRAQALVDGVLVDAGPLAAEAGFQYPVALTFAAWHASVTVSSTDGTHDENSRLWDVLNVLRFSIQAMGGHTSRVDFCVDVADEQERVTTVPLKSLCGPGDHGEPVITILLPDED